MTNARGFSLPELLVAMAIGTIVVGGLVAYQHQATRLSRQAEIAAELADRGRFAMTHIANDARQAGFFGLVGDVELITGRAGPSDPVSVIVAGDCGPNWAINLDIPIDASNSRYDLDCSPYRRQRSAGPDVLTIRRASSEPTRLMTDRVQIQATLEQGVIDVLGTPKLPSAIEVRDLVSTAYYISPVSSLGDDRPGLRRKILRAGPRVVDEEIMPGIDDLQVRFGVAVHDGETPDPVRVWVDPEHAILDDEHATIVAVRVWLLVSADSPPGLHQSQILGYADRSAPPTSDRQRSLRALTIALRNTNGIPRG